jgi:hypothetical protein
MNVFMKDKPKETFPQPPPMPSEIKALAEQRKREEDEKLEKAAQEGENLGVVVNTGGKTHRSSGNRTAVTSGDTSTDIPTTIDPTETPKIDAPPPLKPSSDNSPKPPPVKPLTANTPAKKPETPVEKPAKEGEKRKGKKGDGDN